MIILNHTHSLYTQREDDQSPLQSHNQEVHLLSMNIACSKNKKWYKQHTSTEMIDNVGEDEGKSRRAIYCLSDITWVDSK